MKKKSFYLVLALIMMSAASVKAQVLIGGDAADEPHAGAVLDLSPASGNSLGLLLPNVALSDDASVFVLVPDGTPDFETIKQTAAGMIVYNTAYVLKGAGIYVWDGNNWTPLRDPCPNSITDARDGNVYCIGDFGAAGTWMTQNLRYQGDSQTILINNNYPEISDVNCYAYPNGDASLFAKHPEYGLLYNWGTATCRTNTDGIDDNNKGETPTYPGICPDGWHVPNDPEWSALEKEIADSGQGVYSGEGPLTITALWWNLKYDRGNYAKKMMSKTALENGECLPIGVSNRCDDNGFDALMVGIVVSDTGIRMYGCGTILLSSSSANETTAWVRLMDGTETMLYPVREKWTKSHMGSLRCKRN
jgi:uncharacterized protein (TIGR02145 family)